MIRLEFIGTVEDVKELGWLQQNTFAASVEVLPE